MDATALANLLAWSLQIGLLTIVGGVLLRALHIDAPVIRHAYWRTLLVICLLLPAIQPWRSTPTLLGVATSDFQLTAPVAEINVQEIGGAAPPMTARLARNVRAHWMTWIGFVLAAGVAARLAWLAVGLLRLQRLRRAGALAAPRGESEELSALTEAGAQIRFVPRLGQPVTFGLFKPMVLLPESFTALPPAVQRVVLAHELWHIRRHDWGWVLAEEAVRAAWWFNPAVWWLVSRVQSTREEVVDELTVQLTNARRTYLEALLMFADEPAAFPAAPFARRRQLFHRMLLISREVVMSSRRIIVSSIAALAVIGLTGWYAASVFPLSAAAASIVPPSVPPPSTQNPPRDRRPGDAGPETARERELKQMINSGSVQPDQYSELARLQETRGAIAEAETTWIAATHTQVSAYAQTMLAAFYNRTGRFDMAMATLEKMSAASPSTPQIYQIMATFYWEKASKDTSLSDAQKRAYVDSGIEAADRALAVQDDYVDAIVYKSILTRHRASLEPDAASRQALLAQADALRNRALELQKARGGPTMAFSPAMDQGTLPPPPPPPPPPPGSEGMAPVRVGGNIKPPAKVRDVKPIYPPEAMDGKVQGVVVMEITVDTAGYVMTARVLRSQPLLDQAALDAVKQWQFQPTLLNGAPVPVIMTVTVNFTLQ